MMARIQKHRENHRNRTLERVFGRCPDKLFEGALEIGADYGFQSRIIIKYISKLISTDIAPSILDQKSDDAITFLYCDAQNEISKKFSEGQFDLVFSSNVLEHLENPGLALQSIHRVLKDDGITIHIMPSSFFVVLQSLLHTPHKMLWRLERNGENNRANGHFAESDNTAPTTTATNVPNIPGWIPSPGLPPEGQNALHHKIRRFLLPSPHGVSKDLAQEFEAFSRAAWRRQFESAGFQLAAIYPAPVPTMMRGIPLGALQPLLEKVGLATEYIYVAVKQNKSSRYAAYFG